MPLYYGGAAIVKKIDGNGKRIVRPAGRLTISSGLRKCVVGAIPCAMLQAMQYHPENKLGAKISECQCDESNQCPAYGYHASPAACSPAP